jgi:hypothetical protein
LYVHAPSLLLQGCAVDEVVATIIKSGGPQDNGTKAEACRFHDDKVGGIPVWLTERPQQLCFQDHSLRKCCKA